MARKNRLVAELEADAAREHAKCNGKHQPAAEPCAEGHGDAWEPPEDRLPGSRDGKVHPESDLVEPPAYQPLPLTALPQPLRDYADAAAAALEVDPGFVALPLLCTLAGAIGNSRRLELKKSWSEPAILWGAIIGESGTQKSPAIDAAKRFPRRRQQLARKRFEEAMTAYEVEFARYERDYRDWKNKSKGDTEPPEKPDAPVWDRCLVDDTTIEALAPILLDNWRGVAVVKDELAGWLGAFDKYAGKGGKQGSDAAKWIEMHGGRTVVIDRKTGVPRTIVVPMAAVSVTGGIQPGILQRAISKDLRENGLLARLLLVWPPRRPKRWTECDVAPSLTQAMGVAYDRLFELAPIQDDDGEPTSQMVRLSPEAKALFVAFADAHGQEQMQLDGDLASAWSKLEGYAARLALIHHETRWAANEVGDDTILDAESMSAGIDLSRWFAAEARRVYRALEESDQDRETAELLKVIQSRGGTITARELGHSGPRKYRRAGKAEEALQALVKAGLGQWVSLPTNGRPARMFSAW